MPSHKILINSRPVSYTHLNNDIKKVKYLNAFYKFIKNEYSNFIATNLTKENVLDDFNKLEMKYKEFIHRSYIEGKSEQAMMAYFEMCIRDRLYSIGDNSKLFKNAKDQYLSYNISEIGEVISIYDIYGQAVNLNVPKEQKYTGSLLYKYSNKNRKDYSCLLYTSGTLKADRSPTNRRFYTDDHYKQYLKSVNKLDIQPIEESKNIEVDIRLRKENSIFIVEVQNIKTKEYVEMYRTTSYEHSIDLVNKYIKDFNMVGIDTNITNDIK